jgi:catechol 2,3-dioxygenase-like lactoylglutathione lyase family enzyme
MSTVAPHGLHHVTAIASDPQRNVDFYTEVLGLRLVKTTGELRRSRHVPPLLRRRGRAPVDDPDLLPVAGGATRPPGQPD